MASWSDCFQVAMNLSTISSQACQVRICHTAFHLIKILDNTAFTTLHNPGPSSQSRPNESSSVGCIYQSSSACRWTLYTLIQYTPPQSCPPFSPLRHFLRSSLTFIDSSWALSPSSLDVLLPRTRLSVPFGKGKVPRVKKLNQSERWTGETTTILVLVIDV